MRIIDQLKPKIIAIVKRLKPNIVTRYILKEHVNPFVFSLSAIAFIFILNVVFRDLGRLLGKGLPAFDILQFFFFNIAWILALAIPMGVLISCLSTFGRLAADNEITALKACGTNMIRMIVPVLISACLLAVGMVLFNNHVLPDFNLKARTLMSDISRKRPTIIIEPHIFFDEIPGYKILVHEINDRTNEVKGIIIHDLHESQKMRTLTASSGTITLSEKEERLIFELNHVEIHEIEHDRLGNYHRSFSTKEKYPFEIDINWEKSNPEQRSRGDREKTSKMMKEEVQAYHQRIQEREKEIRILTKLECQRAFPKAWKIARDSTELSHQAPLYPGIRNARARVQRLLMQIRSDINIINSYKRSVRSLQVEIDKKVAIPVACIVFVLIGAPLGIMARHGGMTAWILSLIFFLVYWSCLIGGEQLADRGYISPWAAMWSANIIVGSLGIYLLIHSVRETTFIQWDQWRMRLIALVRKK